MSPDEIEVIGEASSAETRAEAVLAKDEEEMKEEVPPDGKETSTEWKEGPHKIIEQRGGPGEEVRGMIDNIDGDINIVYRSTWRSSITHSSLLNEPCTPCSLEEKVAPYKQVARIFTSYTIRRKISIGELNTSKKMLSMIHMH
jgi:hypothetical protein